MLILQITDTHIKLPGKLAYKKVDTAAMLRDCVAEVMTLDPRPDVIALTGDLVDLGDGNLLIADINAVDEAAFQDLLPEATAIVESIQFRSPAP